MLVEALAAKWGVDQAMVGQKVWIELDTGRARHCDSPPTQNQATARPGGTEQYQTRQPGQPPGATRDDSHQAAGTGGIEAEQTASVCRCAAALIHELGWDPLAETCNTAGPLPMDVAIFTVTEARGYSHPDDILDAVLTHIAGLLCAPPPSSTVTQQRPLQAGNPRLTAQTGSVRRPTRIASIDNITLRNSEDEENAHRAA